MATEAQNRPILLIAHPRSCSTAFERILMTRKEILTCLNEPFADPFFNGPESLSERLRLEGRNVAVDGYEDCTFKSAVDKIFSADGSNGKRTFVKDTAKQIEPPNNEKPSLAPSFQAPPEPGNPTVLPLSVLNRFLWTFLIRHPASSVPSLYRLTIPPLSEQTGWHTFYPSEVGYMELRKLLQYLLGQGLVDKDQLCLIDADDLLNQPEMVVRNYCRFVGLDFKPEMLQWDSLADDAHAHEVFASWTGFHLDAIKSRGFKGRKNGKAERSREEEDEAWAREFGDASAKLIRKTVDENLEHYEFLRSHAMKF